MDFIRSATLMPFTPRSRKSWEAAATARLRFSSASACETRLIAHLPTLDTKVHLSYAKCRAVGRSAEPCLRRRLLLVLGLRTRADLRRSVTDRAVVLATSIRPHLTGS